MSVLTNDRMLLCAKGCGRFAQNAICAVCLQEEVDQLSERLTANHAKLAIDPRAARIAELEAALREIAEHPHQSYEVSSIEVADGHRCAANIARRALNPSIELNLNDKETE